MWPWSRNSECGRLSAVRAMFACPALAWTTTRICGVFARVVGPEIRAWNVGLKASLVHPVAWKAAEIANRLQWAALAGCEPPPFNVPAVAPLEQLVGLSMNLWRFMFRSI